MKNLPLTDQFKIYLADLKIATSDYLAMVVTYKVLRYLANSCQTVDEICISNAMRTKIYQQALQRYPTNITAAFGIDSAQTVTLLCKTLKTLGFNNDYTSFFLTFCPAMVSDWSVVRALEAEGVAVLDALYSMVSAFAVTSKEESWSKDHHEYFSMVRSKCPSLSLEAYDRLWDAMRGFDFADLKVPPISERTEETLKEYARRAVGKKDLMRDYLRTFPDVGQRPICYELLTQDEKECLKVPKTSAENTQDYFLLAQNLAATALPSRVLTRLYYKKHSTPQIDSCVALKAFANRIHKAQNPIVLNPSPAFLEAWTTAEPALPAITVVVPSRQIGLALSQEYTTVKFCSIEEAHSKPLKTDLSLVFCEATEGTVHPSLSTLINCVEHIVNAESVICIREKALTENTVLVDALAQKHLSLRQAIQMPRRLCVGSKKTLLLVRKHDNEEGFKENGICELCQLVGVDDANAAEIIGAYLSPDVFHFATSGLGTGKTLASLVAAYIAMPPNTEASSRNAPVCVPWSKEINIYVTKSRSPTGVRGKINIKKTPRTEGGKPGISLFGQIGEVDIRAKTEAALIEKAMLVPLKSGYFELVANDAYEAFRGRGEGVSLKTIWLTLRIKSRAVRGRDEEALVMFCGQDQSLANMTFGSTYEDLKAALQKILCTQLVPKRYWLFLKILANQAVKHGLILLNPLERIWEKVEKEDNRIIHQIQESLRDWSFSQKELDRMVFPLLEPISDGKGAVYQYEINSHILAKLFVVFTMVHKNELCALTFGDIELLQNGDAQVLITKYVDEDGKVCQYTGNGRHRVLRRKTALVQLLVYCYKRRKQYVASLLNIQEGELRDIPLFWETEVSEKSKVRRLSMKTAKKLYDQLLEASQREESDMKQGEHLAVNDGDAVRYVDIGVSRKTEFIFINSLRIWAEAICGCENGEITYNAATEAEATLDRFYTGWDAAYNQVGTAGKLDRLTARYMARLFPAQKKSRKKTVVTTDSMHEEKWTPPADKLGRLRVEIPMDPNTSLQVKVATQYGHKTNVAVYTEEDE